MGHKARPVTSGTTAGFVTLDADSLDQHHICCALGDPKHATGVAQKKEWLRERFAEGLVFRMLDVRGKVFIEYAPAETAWRPVVAPGWLVVHCLWVSGRFAGHGYGRQLVEYALDDARNRGKYGLVVAAARRKRPFLSDPRFLARLGFEACDRRGEFVLFANRVADGGAAPQFAPSVQIADAPPRGPFVARHTAQCPFNAHWAEDMAAAVRDQGYDCRVEALTRRRDAQAVASPLGAFGLEQQGRLVTHHLGTRGAVARLLK